MYLWVLKKNSNPAGQRPVGCVGKLLINLQRGCPGDELGPELIDGCPEGGNVCALEDVVPQLNRVGDSVLEELAEVLNQMGDHCVAEGHSPVAKMEEIWNHLRQVGHGDAGDEVQHETNYCQGNDETDLKYNQKDVP